MSGNITVRFKFLIGIVKYYINRNLLYTVKKNSTKIILQHYEWFYPSECQNRGSDSLFSAILLASR